MFCLFFFFKQKTAYEMRISDWSSDVCSSDLLPIADRDPDAPSLWDSAENQRRTVALWRKLAARYADEPWVGGYDILNEPNWDFDGEGGGHGCKEQRNAPLTALLKRITSAIRSRSEEHTSELQSLLRISY